MTAPPAIEGAPLFDPARHEPLADSAWNADRAHAAIARIVDDMQARFDPVRGWPDHPQDEVDGGGTGMKSLYLGAAGNLWALWYLRHVGAVTLRIDPAQHMARVHADYLREPDTRELAPSHFLGEAGVLLVWWRLTGDRAAADRLFAVVRENIPNPTNEALWAAPGTMVAAWHMWRWTHEARWRDLFSDNVGQLWKTWVRSDLAPCHVYAFLALHARTGETVWLERARAFAMHAIGQQARMQEAHGRGRYTLWTGDPGLAVYLWHCLQGRGGMPGLDVLD